MKALIVKEDGLIYAAEVPEEPKWHELPATPDSSDYEIRDEQREEYEAAIASAKESAVLVSDQGAGKNLLHRHYKLSEFLNEIVFSCDPSKAKVELRPGIYPIPDLQWEVKEQRRVIVEALKEHFTITRKP